MSMPPRSKAWATEFLITAHTQLPACNETEYTLAAQSLTGVLDAVMRQNYEEFVKPPQDLMTVEFQIYPADELLLRHLGALCRREEADAVEAEAA